MTSGVAKRRFIYVIGGGSIGAFLAGKYSAAGFETVLVVRSEAQKLAFQDGLEFLPAFGEAGGFRARPKVVVWADCPPFPPQSSVFICSKIFQFEQVLAEVRARLHESNELIFCQNGLGVFEEAEKSLLASGRWQRAICWFGVKPSPHGRAAEFEVAGTPGVELGGGNPERLVRTAEDFRAAQVPVLFEGPVAQAEWRKALWNIALNALCATAQAPNGHMASDPRLRRVAELVVKESMQVGKELGVFLTKADEARVFQAAEATATNLNSMLQDLWAGRRTELEWLNGYIVREGTRLGIATPVNQTLVSLVTYLEEKNVLKRLASPST